MEDLIKNDQVKIKILKELASSDKITPSRLSSILGYKYETIKNALNFFDKIGLIVKEKISHNQKDYEYYILSEFGKDIIKKIGDDKK